MASTASTRFWRVNRAAGRPIPRLDDDDVIDFMVLEAIALKVRHEEAEAEKEQEKKEWKRKTSPALEAMR